jgi:hypothetical protein
LSNHLYLTKGPFSGSSSGNNHKTLKNMLRHVVMFKTRPMPEEEKTIAIERLKRAIDALEQEVPQVKFLQTGINFNTRPQAFDLVLISDFEREEDLDIYRDHPQHQRVMDIIHEAVDKVHVVDFYL